MTLFQLMGTDFRAFFLLVETITGIRRNPIFKKCFCWGKQIFRLMEAISFLHFSETLARGNGFSGWWKPLYFVQRLFLMVETVTSINRSQFWKKDHSLTNENWFFWLVEIIFFHFLQNQSTATSGSIFFS